MAGIGAPLKHDWEGLYAEFIQLNQDKEVFLKDYCKVKGLSYPYTSRNFAAIERDVENHRVAKTRRSISMMAPNAAQCLRELLGSDDEKVRERVALGILDRAGLAPQVATTRITNIHAQNAQVIIPPLFAQTYQADAERMLGGNVIGIGDGIEPGDAGADTPSSLDSKVVRDDLAADRPRAYPSGTDGAAFEVRPSKPRYRDGKAVTRKDLAKARRSKSAD